MLQLLGETFLQPTETFRTILQRQVSRSTLIQVAALLAAISGIVEGLLIPEAPAPEPGGPQSLSMPPIVSAIFQFGSMIMTAGLMAGIGRIFGGTGTFDRALLISVWIAAAFLIPGLLVVMIGVAMPEARGLVLMIFLIWNLVVLVRGLQALHGFESFGLTLFGVLGSAFLLGLFALIVLSMFGLAP